MRLTLAVVVLVALGGCAHRQRVASGNDMCASIGRESRGRRVGAALAAFGDSLSGEASRPATRRDIDRALEEHDRQQARREREAWLMDYCARRRAVSMNAGSGIDPETPR